MQENINYGWETCRSPWQGNSCRETGLRRRGAAEAMIPLLSQQEGPNRRGESALSSSWDDHGDSLPRIAVYWTGVTWEAGGECPEVEPSKARDEGKSETENCLCRADRRMTAAMSVR